LSSRLVSRNEIQWACAWAAFLVGLTCLPYLFGAAIAGYGRHYLGFVYNPDEPNVHLAWIRQAREGRVFLRNEYTHEPHEGRFFNVFMLGLGRLARGLNASPYQVFQAARLVFGFLLLVAVYLCVATFTTNRRHRQLAFLLTATSSGLGWLYVGLTRGQGALDPVDVPPGLTMPEAMTFLTVYLHPLFSFSVLLLLISLTLAARALEQQRLSLAVAAGLTALLLANSHTYDILPFYTVLGLWVMGRAVWQRRWVWPEWAVLLLVVLLSAPAVGYQYHLMQSDPLYAAKAYTETRSPPLRTFLLSYGLLIPLALGGIYVLSRRKQQRLGLFILWAVVGFLLVYLPVAFQRKMAEGLHVPLCVLAAVGLSRGGARLAAALAAPGARTRLRLRRRMQRWRRGLLTLGVLALMPSNAFFVWANGHDLLTNNTDPERRTLPPYYLDEAEYQCLLWLQQHSEPDALILCVPQLGSYVPPLIGRRVYLGHWAETIRFADKIERFRRFLGEETNAAWKERFLRDNGVDYLLLPTWEGRRLATTLPGLERVFEQGDMAIYRAGGTLGDQGTGGQGDQGTGCGHGRRVRNGAR